MVAFNAVRVRTTIGGALGTLDVTSTGFGTPKAAILVATFATADDTATGPLGMSKAITDGTTHRCISGRSMDNLTASNATRSRLATFADGTLLHFNIVGSGITTGAQFSFNSWITDGIRLDVDVAPATNATLEVIFLNGDDLDVEVRTVTHPASTGVTATVSGVAFPPDALVFFHLGNTDTGITADANTGANFGIGFATRTPFAQTGRIFYDGGGAGDVQVQSSIRSDACIQKANQAGFLGGAEILTFTSDGWTWVRDNTVGTTPAVTADPSVLILGLSGSLQAHCALESSGTADSLSVTDPGFSPQLGLIAPSRHPTADVGTSDANAGVYSLGYFFRGGDEASLTVTCQDNRDVTVAEPTVCKSFRASEAYRAPLDDGTYGTDSQQGSVTTTGVGFDIAFSAFDDTTARLFSYLVIGAPAVFELAEQETIEEEVFGVVHKFVAIDETETIIENNVESVVRASVFRDFLAQAGHTPVDQAQAGHAAADPAQAGYDQSP